MKMPSSTIKIVGLTITASIILLLVVVVVSLCGEVAVAVAVTVTATTSEYDISSSNSSSSSRIRHDDSSGGTISLVHWNKNKSRMRRSKTNKNRDNNLDPNPNTTPFIIEPLQFLRQDFDYSSGDDKGDSSSSYGNKVSTTGVTVFDLNQDGYQDIFYSAGRHSMDQSYVLMNLGPIYNSEFEFLKYQFSTPLKVGPRNGYFQIDVMDGNSFKGIIDEKNHTGVLLVGGNCVVTKKERKNGNTLCPYDGYNTPSILLDVNVSSTEGGCSAIVTVPNTTTTNSNKTATASASVSTKECHTYKLDWKIIWTDLYPRQYIGGDSGDRNGAFISTVTSSSQDPPAIVLQGVDGIKIYEATKKPRIIRKIDNETTAEEIYYYEYGNSPTYHIPTTKIPTAKNKQRNDNNNTKDGVYYKNINRFTGLAHGYVGTEPGFVSGPRTGSRTFPDEGPAPPLVAVIKDSETGQYRHYEFEYNENIYNGNSSLALQPTGLALSDLNGDGSMDVLQTGFLYENEILSDYPLPQNYYLFSTNTTPAGSTRESIDNRTIIKSNGNSNSNSDKNFSSQQRKLLMNDGDGNNNNNGIKKSSSIHNNNITKTPFDSLLSGGRSIATGNIYNVSPYNDIVLGTSARTITNKSKSNSNSNSNTTAGTATGNCHNKNNNAIIIPATIRLYANMGVDVKSNIFLGFQFVQELVVGGNSNSGGLVTKNNNLDLDCSIRDITVSSLQPPPSSTSTSLSSKIISIITAIDCNSESGSNQEFGNVMFHAIIDDLTTTS